MAFQQTQHAWRVGNVPDIHCLPGGPQEDSFWTVRFGPEAGNSPECAEHSETHPGDGNAAADGGGEKFHQREKISGFLRGERDWDTVTFFEEEETTFSSQSV